MELHLEENFPTAFAAEIKSISYLPSFLYSIQPTPFLRLYLPCSYSHSLFFTYICSCFIYRIAYSSKISSPLRPKSTSSLHQFALLLCVLFKWIWGGGAMYSYPGQELAAHFYSTRIRWFPFLFYALLGKVRMEPSLVTRNMLMEWKFTVVYRMKKRQLRHMTCHNIGSPKYITF
jgi:hypothetical protein